MSQIEPFQDKITFRRCAEELHCWHEKCSTTWPKSMMKMTLFSYFFDLDVDAIA